MVALKYIFEILFIFEKKIQEHQGTFKELFGILANYR